MILTFLELGLLLFFQAWCVSLKYEIYLIYSGCDNISYKEQLLRKKARASLEKFHKSKFKISWVDKNWSNILRKNCKWKNYLHRQSWQGQIVNYYYHCIMASSDLENEVAVCSTDTYVWKKWLRIIWCHGGC